MKVEFTDKTSTCRYSDPGIFKKLIIYKKLKPLTAIKTLDVSKDVIKEKYP